MNAIVLIALKRPYTFVVFALLILILGIFSIETMPTDIFPNIDIPVITVVWQYTGLSADQIAKLYSDGVLLRAAEPESAAAGG